MSCRNPLLALFTSLLLAACATQQATQQATQPPPRAAVSLAAQNVVIYALGLVDTGYRFGGKNPAAGFDCSGMVSHVFAKAANFPLTGSAADMAKRGRPVNSKDMQPGDLVFFNTDGKPYSHVGIYIGDGRFVHAPSSNGKVRVDNLKSGWFAPRFEEARSYLE